MGLHTSLPERPWEEPDIGIPVASVATARRADTRNLGTTVRTRDRVPVVLRELSGREPVIRRVVLCVILYCLPLITLSRPVLDPDLWWHLRTGQWVVQHGRVPATDPFSTFGQRGPG